MQENFDLRENFEKIKQLLSQHVVEQETDSKDEKEDLAETMMHSGEEIVRSDVEKIEIALEVLADMKSMLKDDVPEIEEGMINFRKGCGKGKKSNHIVYLGEDQTWKETYRYFASQILNILVQKIPLSQKESSQTDEELSGQKEEAETGMNLEKYREEQCKKYMEQIYH